MPNRRGADSVSRWKLEVLAVLGADDVQNIFVAVAFHRRGGSLNESCGVGGSFDSWEIEYEGSAIPRLARR
jgi:hypothetical protein